MNFYFLVTNFETIDINEFCEKFFAIPNIEDEKLKKNFLFSSPQSSPEVKVQIDPEFPECLKLIKKDWRKIKVNLFTVM